RRPTGGTAGHNGLADIERALGTRDYSRLRIGIDEPPPSMTQTAWVLGRFTEEQEERLAPALERAVAACESFVSRGITLTMNDFNYRSDTGAEGMNPGWLGGSSQET